MYPGGICPRVLTPLELLYRLAALVPPRIHRHRYFGLLSRTAAHGKFPRRPRTVGVGRVRPFRVEYGAARSSNLLASQNVPILSN